MMEKQNFLSLGIPGIILLLLTLTLPVFMAANSVHGHGFGIYAQGAKAMGMGGTATAVADDPTAVYYNPAGLNDIQGTQALIGVSYFPPRTGTFESAGTSGVPGAARGQTTDLEPSGHLAPFFHLTHKYSEKVSLGIGVYAPWGQSTEWPEDWEGRFTPGGIHAGLDSLRVQPVVSYALNKKLNLAGGVFLQTLNLETRQSVWAAPLGREFDLEVEGDEQGFGWTMGAILKPGDNLRLGAVYRSETRYELDAMRVDIAPEFPLMGITDTTGEMDFVTPAVFGAGIAATWERITVAVDVLWTEWSVQDEYDLKFKDPLLGLTGIRTPKNWENTFTYSIGVDYLPAKWLALRGGYIYDESPVPDETLDPTVFTGDSQLFCFGLGIKYDSIVFDFAYSHIVSGDRNFNNAQGSLPNPGGSRITGEFRDSTGQIITSSLRYAF